MKGLILLSLGGIALASPLVLRGVDPRSDPTYVQCSEGSSNPICQTLAQPSSDVITEITYPNGTTVTKRNLYTRDELKAIRKRNGVQSVKRNVGEVYENGAANFVKDLTKRESAPPVCWTERQKWFDQHEYGFWYQSWQQVGDCFYCDNCDWGITYSFAVSQTWTVSLGVDFDEVIKATFDFSWGQTQTLSDTRTCKWSTGQEYGCHTIWYQPLMAYHNGYPNYQTHTHCSAGQGQDESDSYYDHQWAYANVNQAGNPSANGVNQGNIGCNSGCGGDDHRQCEHRNGGGSLWPNPN